MTINEGQYCHVDTTDVDFVDSGPRRLPQNWQQPDGAWYYNINNSDLWSDPQLATIYWLPYVEIDAGEPQDGKSYNRTLSDFDIEVARVTRTAIYTEWTQAEYDLNADTTLEDSQRVAADLADQTERILQQNTYRNDNGKTPIVPADDVADVNTYLGSLYDAMDDPANPVTEPPGAIRQITEVPGEQRDRGVVRRELYLHTDTFEYTRLTYVLYPSPDVDPTGMSFKVHLTDGTFLSTYNLTDQGDGSWLAQTNLVGQLRGDVALDYTLFKGVDISQKRRKEAGDFTDDVFDVRWLNSVGLQTAIDRGDLSELIPSVARGRAIGRP